MNSTHCTLAAAAALLAFAPAATAQQRWTINPDQDNSIYEPPPGTGRSNGAFEGIFAGNTSAGLARRALMRFDIAGNIPAGATITSVSLNLTVTQAPPAVPNHPFTLHPLQSAWGEGASNSGLPGGLGAAAGPGDATWGMAIMPATPWTTPGGDFVPAPSATMMVGTSGQFTWSSASMVADVQAWLDGSIPNHGWILLGDEVGTMTARRFGSRENPIVNARPTLVIDYTDPSGGLLGGPFPTFCDISDGALAACPCANAGLPNTGCDIQQGTGGVLLEVIEQRVSPNNRTTVRATGFPAASSPTAIVIRAASLEPVPVVFGDGLRCIGTPLVRLAGTFASGGTSIHTFGHGTMAGTGTFYYQTWFRNTPAMFCTPSAFNLSNGQTITW